MIGSEGISIIYYNVAACIIVTALLIALFIRRLFKGRTNRLFLILLFTILISGICDTYDLYYDVVLAPDLAHFNLVTLSTYVYFIARNLTAPLYVLYLCSYLGIWNKLRRKTALFWLCLIPIILDMGLLFSNIVTNRVFSFDESCHYSRGPMLYGFHIVAFFYILFGFVLTIRYRKLFFDKRIILFLLFLPVNAIAVLIELLNRSARVEVLATVIVSMVITIEIQRPEDMIDSVVGAGSYSAFLTDIKKNYSAENPHVVLLIKFVNHATLRSSIGLELYLMLLRKISDKIYQISRIMNDAGSIYYLDQGAFAIISAADKRGQQLDMGRILSAYMQEPVELDHLEVMLDARICQVNYPEDISSEVSFLNFAHTFHNKLPESNRVMALSTVSDSRDFRMRNDMDAIINRGITNYNFMMYYQPIYSINKKRFTSAEALIRLDDEKYGFVSPALFIPAAEESGAIHQIGDFVLEDVCRFIGSNDFETLGLEYIEVNLSVAQCIESDLFEKIDGLMKKYGVRPDQINLEITETGVDYDPATTDRNIAKLSEAGITFSLDDYGTGYSSVKRVVTLPLNIVKLDKSLVDEMDSALMWTVITNTVRMLKRLNKKILVEGVEDKRSFERFAEIGCDYIQGYYFSRPLPETKFLKFILKENFGLDVD